MKATSERFYFFFQKFWKVYIENQKRKTWEPSKFLALVFMLADLKTKTLETGNDSKRAPGYLFWNMIIYSPNCYVPSIPLQAIGPPMNYQTVICGFGFGRPSTKILVWLLINLFLGLGNYQTIHVLEDSWINFLSLDCPPWIWLPTNCFFLHVAVTLPSKLLLCHATCYTILSLEPVFVQAWFEINF